MDRSPILLCQQGYFPWLHGTRPRNLPRGPFTQRHCACMRVQDEVALLNSCTGGGKPTLSCKRTQAPGLAAASPGKAGGSSLTVGKLDPRGDGAAGRPPSSTWERCAPRLPGTPDVEPVCSGWPCRGLQEAPGPLPAARPASLPACSTSAGGGGARAGSQVKLWEPHTGASVSASVRGSLKI